VFLGSFQGITHPNVHLKLLNHTKGTSLRQATYFEPSNVKIGQGVWALQVSKNKVGKTREAKEKLGWQIHHVLGKNGVERSLPNFAHVFMQAT